MNRLGENMELIARLLPDGSFPEEILRPREGAPVIHEKSRAGLSTLRLAAGPGRYIHSRYNPAREAERVAATLEGFVVIIGFGCGYLAAAAARRPEVTGVLAVEPSARVAAIVAESAELPHLREPPTKLRLLINPTPERVSSWVRSFYLPAIHERISLQLTDGYEELVELPRYRAAFTEGIELAVAGYRTMARLGRQWTRNILYNIAAVTDGRRPSVRRFALPAPAEASSGRPGALLLIGAGPSLQRWLHAGAPLPEAKTTLLCADTAEPILRRHGIRPAATMVIDAQIVGYHHLLTGRLPGTTRPAGGSTVLADLTAPTFLLRRDEELRFFGGGHPLATYLLPPAGEERDPSTEGGNVGYTLLSLGNLIASSTPYTVGLDFAYHHGVGYARGSYLHVHFHAGSRRTLPVTAAWSGILYRDPEYRRLDAPGSWNYTEPKLERFRADAGVYRQRQLETEGGAYRRSGTTAYDLRKETPPSFTARREDAGEIIRRLEELQERLRGPLREPRDPPWCLDELSTLLMPLAAWYREQRRWDNLAPFEAAGQHTRTLLAALQERDGRERFSPEAG